MVLYGLYVFLSVVGVAAIAGVCHQVYFSETNVQRRLLRTAKHVPIQEFGDGDIGKIIGQVEYGDVPLIAPLSGRPCAYYEATVEQGNEDRWVLLARAARGCRFQVRDGSGVAVVEPEHARVFIVKDYQNYVSPGGEATPVARAFLDKHLHKSRRRHLNRTKTLRYREGIVEMGEAVGVLGFGLREPDPGAVTESSGYRDGPFMRLVMSGSARYPLMITDDPAQLGQRALAASTLNPDAVDPDDADEPPNA